MKLMITTGISIAAAVAVIVATASGQSTPTTTTALKSTTIKLVQRDEHFQFIDVAPKGGARKPPSQGDEFVIGGMLTEAGRSAGTSNFVCTVTQPGSKGLSVCVGTLVLNGGTVTINGVSRLATDTDTYAVTGETGRYASATGSVDTATGKNDTTILVVHLG